jgi:rare lipoprotein A
MNFFYRLSILLGFFFYIHTADAQSIRNSGMASCYPVSSEGQITASGEVYSSGLYTASHAYLPFNTIVRVTNIRTNTSVLVRINDRFPYKTNRLIDVSKSAANELRLFDHIAPLVSLEVIEMPEEESSNGEKACCGG